MIAEAQRGAFGAIIVWNSDRFSRGDICDTEHYRYLLRRANVRLVSVTEDCLDRDGLDGDVLAESDPGRAAPYGYDREIIAPDGSLLFRIRFCPGRVREVYDKDGKLQARYAKGQALSKPGRECRARLVLSDPQRVQVVRDIFRLCLEGVGFASIAAELNAKGIPGPCRDTWGFTTIKTILENPTYRGDLVWNRRTVTKFYRVQNGRTQRRRRHAQRPDPRHNRRLHRPDHHLALSEARRDAPEPGHGAALETKRPPRRTVAGKPDRGDRIRTCDLLHPMQTR